MIFKGFTEIELACIFSFLSLAAREGDYITRRMLEEILAEEENPINSFGKLLAGITELFIQPDLKLNYKGKVSVNSSFF